MGSFILISFLIFRSEDATDNFLTDSPSLSSFRPPAANLRMAAANGQQQRTAEWSSPPPNRAEWPSSNPPPVAVRNGGGEWSPAPNRAEWSAPPTPRGLRSEWKNGGSQHVNAAVNNGGQNSEHMHHLVNSNNGGMPPAVRPESLPTNAAVDKDKSTLKVHLPNGGFNVVKYGDATDIKVRFIIIFFVRSVIFILWTLSVCPSAKRKLYFIGRINRQKS